MIKQLAICAALSLAALSASAAEPSNKVQGVWRIVERSGNAAVKPQPSMYIFTAKHFSMLVDIADAPRPDAPVDPSKATAQELLAAWGPFVANAGTYEVKGNEITTRPTVAKNPKAVSSGAIRVYSFKFEGDVLVLSPIRSKDGPITDGGSFRLQRVE